MRRVVLIALVLLAALPAGAVAQTAGGDDARVSVTGPVLIGADEVAEDVFVIDGPVVVAGQVRGDLVVINGPVRISGRVGGDVVVAAGRTTLTPGARVGGDLVYGDERPSVPAGATVGGEVKRVDVGRIADPLGFVGGLAIWIAVTVSTLILGLVLLWLAPRGMDAIAAAGATSIGPVIGWGLLLFFGLPLLAVLALVTIVGIPLGIGLLLALVPIYSIGHTCGAWLIGRRLLSPPRSAVLAFLAGLAIVRVLGIVPILGGLVWFVATVLGLGAIIVAVWRARSGQAAPAGAAAT